MDEGNDLLHNIGRLERTENGDFAEGSGGHTLIIFAQNGLLECNNLPGLDVLRLVDLSVCALAEELGALIVFHLACRRAKSGCLAMTRTMGDSMSGFREKPSGRS